MQCRIQIKILYIELNLHIVRSISTHRSISLQIQTTGTGWTTTDRRELVLKFLKSTLSTLSEKTTMDEPMNSYQPVQTTDKENERRDRKKHCDHDDEVPGKEALTTDEKCCCSCLQSLDSPYLFVFWLSLVCFVLSASFSATG